LQLTALKPGKSWARAVQLFTDHGGENITLVPCLNASDLSITMLHMLINENLVTPGNL
jgi:protoheme ferro-lyase